MEDLLKQRIESLERFETSRRVVVTHNGMFHADEVVAIALLRKVYPGVTWKRSRDPRIWEAGDLLLDVGEGLWDHHGPCLERNGDFIDGIPHCAASLVYGTLVETANLPSGDILKNAITAIAAQDNGKPIPFKIVHMFPFVSLFNVPWNVARCFQDDAFEAAVGLAVEVLHQIVVQQEAANEAAMLVEELPLTAAVVELPTAGLPWTPVLASSTSAAQFVVFLGDNDTWFVQCVPPSPDKLMEKRRPFPEGWAGLRAEALEAASGISGAVFCHVGRFLSGWKTREAALKAAEAALR